MVRKPSSRNPAKPTLAGADALWHSTFDAITDALCLVDPQGVVRRCNEAFAKFVGRAPDAVVGEDCCTLIHGGSDHPPDCPLPKALKTKVQQEGECLLGNRWVRVSVHPVLDETGTLTGAVPVLFHITERRRAEDAIRESEERYRHALDALPDPVFVKDEQHRWTILNDAYCAFIGYSREQLLGKSDVDFFPREEAEVFRAKDDEAFASGKENVSEENFTDSGGQRHVVSTKKTAYRDSRTGRQFLVGVIRDVTEANRVSEELHRYREHLEDIVEERTHALEAANERLILEAKERAQAEELQAAIYEISEAAQEATNLEQLCVSIHRIVARLMDARNLYIALYDAGENLLRFPYFVDEEDVTPSPRSPHRGLTEYILRTGQPLLATPEVFEGLVRRGEVESIGAPSIDWLGVPLIVGNQTIGALVIQTYHEGVRYGEREKNILTFVSRQVAHAIERTRTKEMLRENEVRYRVLFESAYDAIFLMKDDRFVDCNARTLELFGCEREQILNHSPVEFSPQTQRDGSLSASSAHIRIQAALAGEPQTFEWLHCRHDRSVFDAEVSLKRIELGGEVFVQAIVRDITEHRRADDLKAAIYEISEAAQRAVSLDELFRSIHAIVGRLMEARNLYIALYDSTTNLLSFPYFIDEVDDRPDPYPAEKGLTSHVVRTGQPLLATPEVLRDFEERGEVRQLGAASIDWLGVPLKVQGRVIGVLTVQSYGGDVRYSEGDQEVLSYVSAQVAQAIERKRAEEALRSSESQLQTVLESSFEGILAVDNEGNVIKASRQFAKMWHIPPSIIESGDDQALLEFVLDQLADPDAFLDKVHALYHSTAVSMDTLLFKDGRAFERLSSPLMREGALAGRVWSFLDITERTRAEEALERSRAQLLQAQKMEAVGRLAGGIAHDFNNVLQTLLSLSQALTGQLDDPERFAATVKELQEAVKRGAALTRQLLLFSRFEPPRLERLDLNEVVKRSSQMIGRLLRENISLTLDLAERPIPVDGDVGQFEQVLVNLVVNAADAMPEGGRLVIRVQSAENTATLEVSDTGSGMTDEVKARIFEPFFTTKEASKGTGLGLSVVHGIMTSHGGRIGVQSVVGQGSTFRLVLPAAASNAHLTQLPTAESVTEIAVGGGERVLVVEDEVGARQGLVQILTMLGYRVTAVGSGSEAAALPAEPGFDALLTDYLLPDVLGTDLAAQLKSRWPRVKVVLMSGYAEDEVLRRRIAAREVRYLQKPFGMEVLARELRAALDKA
jgi:PAS domain S-box-containing protein